MGNPRANVKIKWLDVLNVYGTIPIKLIIIKIINVDEIIEVDPFSWYLNVRDNWVKIVDIGGIVSVDWRELIIQYLVWIIRIIIILVIIKVEFEGNRVLYIYGSKDEKISGIIITRLEITHLKLWRFLV